MNIAKYSCRNEAGESYKAAAVRGLKEELGINGKVKKIMKFTLRRKTETEFDEMFLCRLGSRTKIRFNKKEITSVRFVTRNEIKHMLKAEKHTLSDWSAKILKNYLPKIDF